jgi:acyl-CoA dehydrogenase
MTMMTPKLSVKKAAFIQSYEARVKENKLVATEVYGQVVDRCMQIHCGYGVTKDMPFERWYREIRIRRIGEGPGEVQRHIIAGDIPGASL